MEKVLILSIQGTELDGSGQYYDRSYIKVVDLQTGDKLDWKIGVFTQANGQYHEDSEIKHLEELGFKTYRILPNGKNNKTAEDLAYKYGIDWANYEEEENPLFDGYVFIGEIELEKAKKLTNLYSKNHCVY